MKLGTGRREKGTAEAAGVEALTPIVGGEKQEIRKCFMLISMEISVISQKLLLPALIRPHWRGPPPVLSGWSALSCRRSRGGPRLSPPAPDGPLAAASRRQITEAALTSLSAPRHRRALSQPPPPSPPPHPHPSLSLSPGFLCYPPTDRPALCAEPPRRSVS